MCRIVLAAFCATLILTAASCGGNASRTEVVRLRSAPPVTFVKVIGPAGVVSYLTQRLAAATFKTDQTGVFLPPLHYLHPRCSFTHTISSRDAPELQQWRGRKVRIALYDSVGPFCHVLRSSIYRSSS